MSHLTVRIPRDEYQSNRAEIDRLSARVAELEKIASSVVKYGYTKSGRPRSGMLGLYASKFVRLGIDAARAEEK